MDGARLPAHLGLAMIVGITATQKGLTRKQRRAFRNLIRKLEPTCLHHGDCIGGDVEGLQDARIIYPHITVVVHPPLSDAKRAFSHATTYVEPRSYLVRNRDIVDAVDVLIALPSSRNERLRSGTWATVRYARKQHKAIYYVYQDGCVKHEGAVL